MPAQKINTQGFLSEFARRHKLIPDRPFCWVLGSGASFQSGIPTGGALAMQWLKELHELEDLDNGPIEKWATAANLGIKNFALKKAATFYPWIYWRRYRKFREEGYAFLEKAMEAAEPSYGYSVLAQIMAGTQHKAAVTTNFDNLIADALAVYTRSLPLVCGHESLTGFIRPNLQRPLIAKIHRDLLLNPKNEPEELEKLPEEWSKALGTIFDSYTPIVIGYGGNDGSLMGFLKSLQPIKGGIFWCYRIGDEPDARVHEVVAHHDGSLVPILGFDELMLQLWEKLGLASPIPELDETHKQRLAEWQQQFEELNKRLKSPGVTQAAEKELAPVRAAAAAAVERLTKEKDWWAWQLKANAESDPKKAEEIYREGLVDFPESSELVTALAVFLERIGGRPDEVAELYSDAYRLAPSNQNAVGNYAWCLHGYKKDFDEAERLYLKALELGPRHAHHTANFAGFMFHVRQKFDEAEQLYRKALELDPKNTRIISNFAIFMERARNDVDEAERLYRRAVELDPENPIRLNGLGYFLAKVRRRYSEAEPLLRRAAALEPDNGSILDSLAVLLSESGQDIAQAEKLFRRALKLVPSSAEIAKNYEDFKRKHKGGKK